MFPLGMATADGQVQTNDGEAPSPETVGTGLAVVLCMLFIALCIGLSSPDLDLRTRIFTGLDMFSTLAFAVAGAYVTTQHLQLAKAFNLRLTLLALLGGIMTGVGGGVMRDFVILHAPVALFQSLSMASAAFLGAVIGICVGHHPTCTVNASINMMDSIALGVAIIVGTGKAPIALDTGGVAAWNSIAVVCAFLTSYGGGLLRDLLIRRRPAILGKGLVLFLPVFGALVAVEIIALLRPYMAVTPWDVSYLIVPVFAWANMYLTGRPSRQ